MALYQLDNDGNNILPGSRKQPAKDARDRNHWFYQTTKSAKTKAMNRRFWAKPEDVPKIIEALQGNVPLYAATGLKWTDALGLWQDGHPLVSPEHIKIMDMNIRLLCEFAKNPKLTIQDTSRGLFQRWLNDRAQVSPATANKAREIITVAKYCHTRLDVLPEQPEFLGIPKFKTTSIQRKDMPLENVGQYLTACEENYGLSLRLIIEFMIFTGVRSTEASELPDTPDRIRSENLTVMQKAKGVGKRPASVPVDGYLQGIIDRARAWRKEFAAQLRQQIEDNEGQRGKFANDKNRLRRLEVKIDTLNKTLQKLKKCKALFFKESGTAWDRKSLRVRWKGCCDKAGLEYFVPHELRHTHATIAGGCNFNERYLQAAMRWDDPAMARRYVHATKNMAAEVAGKVRSKLADALGVGGVLQPVESVAETVTVPGLAAPYSFSCGCGKIINLVPADPEASGKE